MENNENGESVLQSLLSTMDQVRQRVDVVPDDEDFLTSLLESRTLGSLFQIHKKICQTAKFCVLPEAANTSSLLDEVVEDVLYNPSQDAQELCKILEQPMLRSVLVAHDSIARKDYSPHLPEVPYEVDEDEETVKVVQLVKSNEPLGATIKYDDKIGTIVIARIMQGGAADRSGLIHVGDEVHEVNGIDVKGRTPTEVLHILQSTDGTITLKIIPAEQKTRLRVSKVPETGTYITDTP